MFFYLLVLDAAFLPVGWGKQSLNCSGRVIGVAECAIPVRQRNAACMWDRRWRGRRGVFQDACIDERVVDLRAVRCVGDGKSGYAPAGGLAAP